MHIRPKVSFHILSHELGTAFFLLNSIPKRIKVSHFEFKDQSLVDFLTKHNILLSQTRLINSTKWCNIT